MNPLDHPGTFTFQLAGVIIVAWLFYRMARESHCPGNIIEWWQDRKDRD